jgi:hypothetical protein
MPPSPRKKPHPKTRLPSLLESHPHPEENPTQDPAKLKDYEVLKLGVSED